MLDLMSGEEQQRCADLLFVGVSLLAMLLLLIVPTLRVGMHPVTLRVTLAQDSNLVSTAERRASPAAFPRRAWERSGRVSVEESGRLAGRLALALAVHAPS
jgi:hypothetical protein